MSPPRRSSSGLNYRTWMRAEAKRAVANYKKRTSPSSGSHKTVRTAASLMRLRNRAHQAVVSSQNYNQAILARNLARVKKMLKEITNYKTRHAGYVLVQQPNGTMGLARPRKNR
jgi:hypothetical protein